MSIRFVVPAALLVMFAVGCEGQQAQIEERGETTSRAIVTQAQADRAFTIAQGIDYLPWGYTPDGCYARALYMSMELAVESIPSSSQYIFANTDEATLRPVNGPVWGWHVAPMVKVTATGTPMIIDPALFTRPEVARSLDTWITRNNPTPAGAYDLVLTQGSHYGASTATDSQPIARFEDLNPFAAGDIESACTTAWNYMELETPVPAANALATKRERLVERTRTLITGLRAVSKLTGLTADTLSCDGHARAAEAPTSSSSSSSSSGAPSEPTEPTGDTDAKDEAAE